MFAGVAEMIARAMVGFLFVPLWGYFAACIANPVAWFFACFFLIPAYLVVFRKLKQEKTRTQVTGTFGEISGALSGLSGKSVRGYEIHMGSTVDSENVRQPESRSDEKGYVCRIQNEADGSVKYDGIFSDNVYGTYVHGIFDEGTLAETLVGILAERKGVVLDTGQMISYGQFKQMQYDKLADGLRESMDMEAVYAMLREAAI